MKKGKKAIVAGIVFVIILICLFVVLLLCGVFKSEEKKYEDDIAILKVEKSGKFYFFPDEIPEDASDVKWTKVPTILQGTGHESLSFYASDEYISSVVENYGTNARIFIKCKPYPDEMDEWFSIWPKTGEEVEDKPGEYVEHPFDYASPDAKGIQYITDADFVNSSSFDEEQYNILDLHLEFPGYNELKENGNKDAIIYILYDDDDWNHHSVRGFYVIPEENYIYYFCQ